MNFRPHGPTRVVYLVTTIVKMNMEAEGTMALNAHYSLEDDPDGYTCSLSAFSITVECHFAAMDDNLLVLS